MTNTILFYDPAFPGGPDWQKADVERLGKIGTVTDAQSLSKLLDRADGGVFVTLHAPYFPAEAWDSILAFLKRGGGLVSCGGAPFRQPVILKDEEWLIQTESTAYHRQLRIHELLPVTSGHVASFEASADIPLFRGAEQLFDAANTWNMVPHVTRASDLPHQMGSAGPMDAQLHSLLKAIDGAGRAIAAPVVYMENTKGEFAGGRWIFVNRPLGDRFAERGGLEALRQWAGYCGLGVTELWLKTGYASYELHERPMLTLQAQAMKRGSLAALDPVNWSFDIHVVHQPSGSTVFAHNYNFQVGPELVSTRIPLAIDLQPGQYEVTCTAESAAGEQRIFRQGFWGADRALLAEGTPVRAGRDYFEKDGKPLPVVGMTYMASDVARKFLFLPNVSVWDRDMSQMRKAGINWIRTGIWTAYRNVMQVDGHASEEVQRAIDAFVMTAKKHDLQLTFTFFSFTPEPWEGLNPYLDPRSVEAQKRFVRAIASRHKDTTNVDWDLINEPSMFDPALIFSDGPRSAGDRYEQEAFSGWLANRHGSVESLREKWGMTPGELPDFYSCRIPQAEEINFDVQDMHRGKKGTRWLDYVLFSMEMHNRWAKQLYDAIKDVCPDHMVTVGQDEALGAQRPSPFFYGEAVDYTTVHSWWLNDCLLWDGIFAKTADKPNVVQETGIMYVETPDGFAKRSEEELRAMLERKYAYAFAAGGAGAIQWIWNTNYYMDNANESHIGALRADGTEKPEAEVSYHFGAFMGQISDLFQERVLEDIAVVFPYSNDFGNRKLAFDATTRLTRELGYTLKMPFRGISEYHVSDLTRYPAKLILLPSAHNIDESAFRKLLAIVEQSGAVLVLTGPIGLDAYWRSTDRLASVFGERRPANIVREEAVAIDGRTYPVSFARRRIAEVSKEVVIDAGRNDGAHDEILEAPYGNGRIIWCPLPLELNERSEPMIALYEYALKTAGVEPELDWLSGAELPGVYGRKLGLGQGALFIFVSEYGRDTNIAVRDRATGAEYRFLLERERSVLFAVDQEGELISVYRPDEVAIDFSKGSLEQLS